MVKQNSASEDWEGNPAIIDGENTRCCVYGANRAKLDGFIVQKGYADNRGGGMYNKDASPEVSNCIFAKNTASGEHYAYGGGMYNENASPALKNCTFTENTARALAVSAIVSRMGEECTMIKLPHRQ